ncbi:hypothetical protein [Lysinibacillus fusiformis]|uniref:hypothetical protein n=1 Tax=Lysinibacillus fusiformis TaxID=28031 RepID=UPI00215AC710|nr:hypothetical protein [Lysinibacillus fusiformis]MCR8853518.1 hypothetical protein [Lysinibacillus fusiformis]
MFFILIGVLTILSIGITYFWMLGSQVYIDFSRSSAASNFPGDITAIQKMIYQIIFPSSLLVALLILPFLLYLIFKNKTDFTFGKKVAMYSVSVVCTVYLFIKLYIFIF